MEIVKLIGGRRRPGGAGGPTQPGDGEAHGGRGAARRGAPLPGRLRRLRRRRLRRRLCLAARWGLRWKLDKKG